MLRLRQSFTDPYVMYVCLLLALMMLQLNFFIIVAEKNQIIVYGLDVSEYYLPDHPFHFVREEGNHLYITLAAEKYNDSEILNMRYHRDDRCRSFAANMECCFDETIPETYNQAGPDENFMGWKDVSIDGFRSNTRQIIDAGKHKPNVTKVAWLGNIRSPNEGVLERYTRTLIPQFTANYSNLFHLYHIHPIDIQNQTNFMTQADMVRQFAFLLDIGGNGWSGRLKWLLFSHRPILIVDRPFQDYFHRDLKPYVHYIPVRRDLSDLVTQAEWAMSHPKECAMIASQAFRFAVETFRESKLIERVHEVYTFLKNKTPGVFSKPVPVAQNPPNSRLHPNHQKTRNPPEPRFQKANSNAPHIRK